MTSFYICYKKKNTRNLEYYSNVILFQKNLLSIFNREDRLKTSFLISNFVQINYVPSTPPTHHHISQKPTIIRFYSCKNQTINGNRVSTNYHPFPVATRVHRFKELSRIRPRRWKLSRHQKTRFNSPRRELDNENFELVQTEPHLIALESSLDRLYRASLYTILDRSSRRYVRTRQNQPQSIKDLTR